jgi:hypothetical protein
MTATPAIPTQCDAEAHATVAALARATDPHDGVCVELGCWLGALTDTIVRANPDLCVHAFDRFIVNDAREVPKARKHGGSLHVGQDRLPLFQARFVDYRVHAWRGEITEARWRQGPIALHIDDACKLQPAFDYAIRQFSPAWVPGVTRVVLLDYHYYTRFTGRRRDQLMHQRRWSERYAAQLNLVHDVPRVYRYLGGAVC